MNSIKTDLVELGEFLDRWHTVGLILRPLTLTASLILDGKSLLDGIPLVQGAWAGALPEVLIRTTWTTARIEDFEARYKDLVLRPRTAGEEASQTLSKDSFEGYEAGTFPAQGGWRAPGMQATDLASSTGLDATKSLPLREYDREKRRAAEPASAGRADETGQTKPSTDGQTVLEMGRAAVDEADSATGLRSLLIETDGQGELILVKRLSLPARVPFGVSEGNFAIGAAKIVSQGQLVSRSRLMDERREREGEDARTADRTREKTSETPGRSSGTARIMSASPVGNFYIYSFDGKLLQLYNVYGILLKDYIYMGDRLIAEYDHVGARLLYYTPDQINSTRVVTDGAGNVVYWAVHDPYGGIQQTPQNNTYDPQLKFSGKERDAESGLDYFGARYYDRSQYRFISVDPIIADDRATFNPQLFNTYSYCRNNPIGFLDDDGAYTFRFELHLKIRGWGEVIAYDGDGHPLQYMDHLAAAARSKPEISFYMNEQGQISINFLAGAQINILKEGAGGLTKKSWDKNYKHEKGHCEDLASAMLKIVKEVEEGLRTGTIKSEAEAKKIINGKFDAAVSRSNRIRHFPFRLFFGIFFQYEPFDSFNLTISDDTGH